MPPDKSSTTAELFARHVIPTYARFPLALTRGQGTRVWDEEGRCRLDFTSGIAVNALGHAHPALRDALAAVGRPDIMIVVGGVVPPGDFEELYAAGAAAIYPPGTVIAEAAVSLVRELARRLGYDLS